MKNKTIVLLIILIIIAGISGYWYYRQKTFSKEILKLEILGPESVKAGDVVEYNMKYKNNGNFALEDLKLIFELPKYSLTEDGKTIITKDLGDIYPGEEKNIQFKARLFGKENELKTAQAALSYQPKNLRARYESKTTFTTKIEFVPLTLEFDLPSKLESGRDIQFSLNYFSNIDYSLSDIKIQTEYPSEFEFLESTPAALEKTDWGIPSLKKAEGGRIKIKGRLGGEAGSRLRFGVKIGMWQEGDFILLKETEKEVEIIQPLLYISQQINNFANYIASPGEQLHYEIFFRNIGTTPFENQFLITRLDGAAFDLSTIKAELGEFKADDNLIIWDWKQVPELRFLDVEEEGKVEFDVKLKDYWETTEKNIAIKNKVNISQISEEFQTKVNTKLEVLQKGYYQDEVFGNSGPIPPQAGNTTTFTIVWQIKNYYNDVKNVKVKATLPQGVELTGRIFPQEESAKFSFDPRSREIVWVVKDNQVFEAGTGVSASSPSLAFQVALAPNSNQKGKILPIINEAKITAEDQWTEKTVEGKTPLINTTLPDDQSIPDHSGLIQ